MTDSIKPGAGAVADDEHVQRCPLCNVTAKLSLPAEPDVGLLVPVFACQYHGEFFEVDDFASCGWKFVDGWPYPSEPPKQQSAVLDLAAEYVRGQRSRDAEVEKLQRELAEAQRFAPPGPNRGLTAPEYDSVLEELTIGCESGEGSENLIRRITAALAQGGK